MYPPTHPPAHPFYTTQIVVIHEDAEVLVVSKPPTMPIHPCGAYRHNTVLSILEHERTDMGKLFLIYRLDRLTSGCLILAKSSAKANDLSVELRGGQTKKVYLARVKGEFGAGKVGRKENEKKEEEAEEVEEVLFEDWCPEKVAAMDGGEEERDTGGTGGGCGGGEGEAAAAPDFGKEEGGEGGAEKEEGNDRESRKRRKQQHKQERRQQCLQRKQQRQASATAAPTSSSTPSASTPSPMHWRVQSDGSIAVEAGIRCVSYRDAVYEVSAEGKPSMTLFRSLGYDGEHSLVECRPITGRTHQIRCHIQWLGFPIANDPHYGCEATVAAFKGAWKQEEEGGEENGGRGEEARREMYESLPSVPDLPAKEAETEEEKIQRLCPYCFHGDAVMFKG